MPATGYVFVFENADALRNTSPEAFDTAVSILEDVAQVWAARNVSLLVFIGQGGTARLNAVTTACAYLRCGRPDCRFGGFCNGLGGTWLAGLMRNICPATRVFFNSSMIGPGMPFGRPTNV